MKDGEEDKDNFAPLKKTMEDHLEKYRIKGKLEIRAVHAKYLLRIKGEMPDPFLEMVFPSKEKKSTKVKSKTNFPVWEEKVTSSVDMNRNDAGFIDVEVIDNNTFSNEPLGKFVIDVEPCYAKPGSWEEVNRVFEVEPPKDRESRLV